MATNTYPAEGIARLVIEQAHDAKVWGVPAGEPITVYGVRGNGEGQGEFFADGDTLRLAGGTATQISVPPGVAVQIVDTAGDLRVEGVAGPVQLDAVHGDLRLARIDGPATVFYADGDLRGEDLSELKVRDACRGDIRIQRVGAVDIAAVSGDVHAQEIGTAAFGAIQGDLWLEKVGGDLTIDHVSGDARVSEVAGVTRAAAIGGDLRAGGLGLGLEAQNVAGDASLRGPFGAEASYTLQAAGDVAVHLPVEADVRLELRAAGRIRSDVQLTPAPDGSAAFTATAGRGSSRIAVRCGGDLRVAQAGAREASQQGSDWKELRQRMREEVRAAISADFSDLNGLGERIRQQVLASLASAGIDAESGPAHFDAGRGRGARGSRPPGPGRPPGPDRTPGPNRPLPSSTPPSAPERQRAAGAGAAPAARSTEAEQMSILRMLEAGTITPAEAEQLLKALNS